MSIFATTRRVSPRLRTVLGLLLVVAASAPVSPVAADELLPAVDITIRAVVPEAHIITTMKATPQSLNGQDHGQGQPPFKLHVDLPPAARKVPLHPDQVLLNGYPVQPLPESDLRTGHSHVTLVFSRDDILNLLDGPGEHMLTLRARIGGGHLLEASDQVRVHGQGGDPRPAAIAEPAASTPDGADAPDLIRVYEHLDEWILTLSAPQPVPADTD